jgi:hypothetical protein
MPAGPVLAPALPPPRRRSAMIGVRVEDCNRTRMGTDDCFFICFSLPGSQTFAHTIPTTGSHISDPNPEPSSPLLPDAAANRNRQVLCTSKKPQSPHRRDRAREREAAEEKERAVLWEQRLVTDVRRFPLSSSSSPVATPRTHGRSQEETARGFCPNRVRPRPVPVVDFAAADGIQAAASATDPTFVPSVPDTGNAKHQRARTMDMWCLRI